MIIWWYKRYDFGDDNVNAVEDVHEWEKDATNDDGLEKFVDGTKDAWEFVEDAATEVKMEFRNLWEISRHGERNPERTSK